MPDIGGVPYLQWVPPGFIASTAMFAATFECTFGSYVRMTFQKTFDAILATPLGVEDVAAGEALWGGTRSVMTASAVLVVLLGFDLVRSPWALGVPLVALLQGLMFAGMALTVTALVPNINNFSYYFTLGVTPMFLFSNVFVPLQNMPEPLRALAWVSPLFHAAQLHRALVIGDVHPRLLIHAAFLLVGVLVFLNLSLGLMRRRLVR
jgi:lipooligosaccharide transport system permease protein